jgi:hypothetical protein
MFCIFDAPASINDPCGMHVIRTTWIARTWICDLNRKSDRENAAEARHSIT